MAADPGSPILFFDSGVGGLSVLAEARSLLPAAPVIYAADMAGLPYGTKSEAEVAARVCGLLGRMAERYRPRLICIACNTASTIALGMVRDVLEIPIVGTVPAIKPAAQQTRSGVIGLLGTEATIRQAYVDNLERDFAADKLLLRQAAPQLVQAAESKLAGTGGVALAVEEAVEALRAQPRGDDIDTVVLACTHFPLLRDELSRALGPDVALVDGAQGIARRIAFVTQGQDFARIGPDMAVTTGPLADFERLEPVFAGYGINDLRAF